MARSKQTALSLEDKPSTELENEELPRLAGQPPALRLAYVRDLLRALTPLLAEDELRLLRYLLAMASEEAEVQRRLFEGAPSLKGMGAD